jgi:FMN reductase
MNVVKVVGIGGSMKPGSASLLTLRLALDGAVMAGAEAELLDIRELALPMYSPDVEPTAGVRRLVAAVSAAQGLIWSSPVYHGSVSGAFKNTLDWLELLNDHQPAYLTNKVVGLISTAGGVQGLQAINTMEFVVRALRGWTMPMTIPLDRAFEVFDTAWHIKDGKLRDRLLQLGTEVTQAAQRLGRAAETG